MDHTTALRQHLVKLLTGSEAHADFEAAVKDLPAELRGEISAHAEHSPWQLVEHLRIALWDILEFSRDARHQSPDWPSGYWPTSPIPAGEAAWNAGVEGFRSTLREFSELIQSESTDLYAAIPGGDGQTVLREALLAADHNAYHVGQLVLVRRLLGAWH